MIIVDNVHWQSGQELQNGERLSGPKGLTNSGARQKRLTGESRVSDDVCCQSAASKLVILHRQQDAAAAAAAGTASGAQLAIPVAIDPGHPDETARPDYHAYCGLAGDG